MPKVLLLTRYERLGASSRVRFLQFIPQLERADFAIDVHPLLDNAYVQSLYGGPPVSRWSIIGASIVTIIAGYVYARVNSATDPTLILTVGFVLIVRTVLAEQLDLYDGFTTIQVGTAAEGLERGRLPAQSVPDSLPGRGERVCLVR